MNLTYNNIPSARQVEDLAAGILQKSLQLVDHGYKCTVATLLRVLFFAAARTTSIFDATQRLAESPSDQAVRNALIAQLPASMSRLEERLNHALQAKLPKRLARRRHWPMAADITEICYYGQPWKQQRELRRGKRKAGTTRFHCYATLYLLSRGRRFTLALTYVWKDDTHADVLRRLLEQARRIDLWPQYLLLDRGFYGLETVQYLKSVSCPFVMPVVHRGRRSKKPLSQLKGTRRFLAWKKSGWSTHVMKNRRQQTSVSICVVKSKQPKLRPLVFAFWGFRPPSPAWVAQTYRKRFGIETSYRQMNQGRIGTCSRNPHLRLLLVGIALVLRNLWVWLHLCVLGRVRGRGIELHLERLRLRTMLWMLQRCAEAALHWIQTTQPPANPALQLSSAL